MKLHQIGLDIDATPQRVWNVMVDVEHWPEWTPTMRKVQRLQVGPLEVGSRVRIVQPRLRPAVWTITAWNEGAGFDWISRTAGVTVRASHGIVPREKGCAVSLSVGFEGVLGWFADLYYGALTDRYLRLEAEGLRKRCQSIA